LRIKIKLFAGLREVIGGDLEERIEADTITVAELHRHLEQSQPKLRPYLSALAIAVNDEFVLDDDQLLQDGDEVALIPPVSGGAGTESVPHFLVTPDALDTRALRELVRGDLSGAVVLFEGVVRNRHEGHEVLRIEYQAYESMAQKQLRQVAEAVREELAVHDIAIHHRIGMLEVGDASLAVAVSAEHRGEAFAAALRAVDRVKESVPIWKKEYGPDGATWQQGVPARPARSPDRQPSPPTR
jgi:molybdopterin synthase catalytic subunit